MAQQQPGASQQGTYQQQLQQPQLTGMMQVGAPPKGNQFQGNNSAWANAGQQQRTISPSPGQQASAAAAAGTTSTAAILSGQLQALTNILNQALAAKAQHVVLAGNQVVETRVLQNQVLLLQQQALQLRVQQQQSQQQAGQAARRPGSAGAGAAPVTAAAKAALPASTSAGNLQAYMTQHQRPAAVGAYGLGGIRPVGVAGAMVRPGGLAAAAAQPSAIAQHLLQSLKEGEPPKIAPPDGHEWVQCLNRDGTAGWYAMRKDRAEAHRAQAAKRKAEDAAAGQPAAKAATGGTRRRGDDDLTAGADMNELDVLSTAELKAELASSEAARGAVVLEQGNVQEEYVLNQEATLTLLAREAKRQGVRSLGEGCYHYLSLATERHLTELLHNLVKTRLQREDLGKNYKGVERVDDKLRSGLFQIQKREKEAARKREEEERDELAKLGQTRKKLAEEDKKAAKAAQSARQLEQQQKNLGNTLTKMGIGRRGFGALPSLGRPAGGAAQPKTGFTKPELAEAKAAAAGNDTAAAADAPDAAGTAAANGTAGAVKQESGADNSAVAAAAGSTAASAAAPSVPPVKPVSLQHQLLNAANMLPGAQGAASLAFVAGGASSGRGADGEEGLRELMLADLLAVLERHPLYCKSQQMYTLYALAGK